MLETKSFVIPLATCVKCPQQPPIPTHKRDFLLLSWGEKRADGKNSPQISGALPAPVGAISQDASALRLARKMFLIFDLFPEGARTCFGAHVGSIWGPFGVYFGAEVLFIGPDRCTESYLSERTVAFCLKSTQCTCVCVCDEGNISDRIACVVGA